MSSDYRTEVKTIATHHEPHADEVVAIWLILRFGQKHYKNLRRANKIKYWGKDNLTSHIRDEDGVLLIGIGGGRFDEHGTQGVNRKEGECAATLVAKALGVADLPELKEILEMTIRADQTGFEIVTRDGKRTRRVMSMPMDFADTLKVIGKAGTNPEKTFEIAFAILDAKLAEQKAFHIESPKVFNDRDRTEIVTLKKVKNRFGKPVKLAIIKSDNREVARYARSALGCRAGIVIQRDSRGATQVSTNNWNKLDLTDTVQIIRVMEMKADGKEGAEFKTLREPGVVDDGKWHFIPEGMMMLNGSPTARGVAPSKLNLRQLKYAVEMGLDRRAFPKDRAKDCLAGVCTSTRQDNCPWYNYGLRRCSKIRFEQRKKRQQNRGDRKVVPMRAGRSGY